MSRFFLIFTLFSVLITFAYAQQNITFKALKSQALNIDGIYQNIGYTNIRGYALLPKEPSDDLGNILTNTYFKCIQYCINTFSQNVNYLDYSYSTQACYCKKAFKEFALNSDKICAILVNMS